MIGVKKPPWMDMDQWWKLWHRTGHRWIEKCNMSVLTAIVCQNGLLGNMREGPEMSGDFSGGDGDNSVGKKWRKTNGMVRTQNDSKFTVGRTWCRRRSLSSVEMQTALRNLSKCPQGGCSSLTIVGGGDNWEKPDLEVVNVMTQWRCASCLNGPSAPDKLVRRSLLVASIGAEWWSWLQVEYIGAESLGTSGTK